MNEWMMMTIEDANNVTLDTCIKRIKKTFTLNHKPNDMEKSTSRGAKKQSK